MKKTWFYVSLLPILVAVIGMALAYMAYTQQWGGSAKIATVTAVFFCEIVMVVAALGALSYMKQEKTATTKKILLIDISIAVTGALSGIYLFIA